VTKVVLDYIGRAGALHGEDLLSLVEEARESGITPDQIEKALITLVKRNQLVPKIRKDQFLTLEPPPSSATARSDDTANR